MSNLNSPTNPIDPSFAARIESKYGIKLLRNYSDTEGNPTVDFSSTGGGSVVAEVTADAKSPTSSSAVDWIEMTAKTGSLAHTALFIGTVGGLQPKDVRNPKSA